MEEVDLRKWGAAAAGIAGVVGLGVVGRSWYYRWWWGQRIRKEDGSVADGPAGRLVLGNIGMLSGGFYESLYGFIGCESSVFWIMSTPFVVVTEPAAVQRVLGGDGGIYTKPKYFGYRSKTVSAAVATQKKVVEMEAKDLEGEQDASRKALVELTEKSFGVIMNGVGQLIARLEAGDGCDGRLDSASFTVQSAVTRMNLKILFQFEDEEKADLVGKQVLLAGREFAEQMVNPLRPLLNPFAALRFLYRAISIVRFGRYLGKHLDEVASAGKSNWVHSWIGKVGKVGKLGKVTGLLMASTQTVPTAALWLIFYVYTNPPVLASLREELSNVLGSRKVGELQYEDLEQLQYADCVVRETLRMRPPFPVLVREAQQDDVIAGLKIPSGTAVYIVPWLVHQNKKSWEEPEVFRPERFRGSPEKGGAPSDFAYVPFSRGSRMCGGYRLALAELKTLLVRVVADYECEVEFPAHLTPGFFPPLTMSPHGLQIKLASKAP